MAIIVMSHEMGAGGPEIGQLLGQRLGYRYVDQELISDAAHRYGLLEEKLSHLDESKPSLFERFDAETRRYITVIQTALYEFAERDNVILLSRGGQWLLRGIPHALRVRVMAPFDLLHITKRLLWHRDTETYGCAIQAREERCRRGRSCLKSPANCLRFEHLNRTL